MAKRRKKSKSRRGGASAPAHCRVSLKSCLRNGPALSPTVGKTCFKTFNKCRSGRKRK